MSLSEKYQLALKQVGSADFTFQHGAFYEFLKDCCREDYSVIPSFLHDYFKVYSNARRDIIKRIPGLLTNYVFCAKFPLASNKISSVYDSNPGIHDFTKYVCMDDRFEKWVSLILEIINDETGNKICDIDFSACPFGHENPQNIVAKELNQYGMLLIGGTCHSLSFSVYGIDNDQGNPYTSAFVLDTCSLVTQGVSII